MISSSVHLYCSVITSSVYLYFSVLYSGHWRRYHRPGEVPGGGCGAQGWILHWGAWGRENVSLKIQTKEGAMWIPPKKSLFLVLESFNSTAKYSSLALGEQEQDPSGGDRAAGVSVVKIRWERSQVQWLVRDGHEGGGHSVSRHHQVIKTVTLLIETYLSHWLQRMMTKQWQRW